MILHETKRNKIEAPAKPKLKASSDTESLWTDRLLVLRLHLVGQINVGKRSHSFRKPYSYCLQQQEKSHANCAPFLDNQQSWMLLLVPA
jgi:hypothetical protein